MADQASLLRGILADLRAGDATRDDQQLAADAIELRGRRIAELEARAAALTTALIRAEAIMVNTSSRMRADAETLSAAGLEANLVSDPR